MAIVSWHIWHSASLSRGLVSSFSPILCQHVNLPRCSAAQHCTNLPLGKTSCAQRRPTGRGDHPRSASRQIHVPTCIVDPCFLTRNPGATSCGKAGPNSTNAYVYSIYIYIKIIQICNFTVKPKQDKLVETIYSERGKNEIP